jgi:farnesyl-diphosphate farnesyltransferase
MAVPAAGEIEAALPADGGADVELVRNTGRVLAEFAAQDAGVREVITPWVREMCRGMARYAPQRIRTLDEEQRELSVLATERDLDAYCYYVAGTVGHLLTGLFGQLRPEILHDNLARLDALAESFGAGLQLTNIIIDVSDDQRRGVSYVPEEMCRHQGLSSGALLLPGEHRRARAVMGQLIRKARHHLAVAVAYCEMLPKTEHQIRLFCLLPVFLALRTLREVEATASFPVAGQRVKIGRAAVYRTVAAARLCASSNHLVRAYAQHLEF